MSTVFIPSASAIRASQDMSKFEKSVQSVLRDIQRAQESGRLSTCFNPYYAECYDAVKREFAAKGYTFSPTGFIGGVWQLTENINW